jgi:hypothetical protein
MGRVHVPTLGPVDTVDSVLESSELWNDGTTARVSLRPFRLMPARHVPFKPQRSSNSRPNRLQEPSGASGLMPANRTVRPPVQTIREDRFRQVSRRFRRIPLKFTDLAGSRRPNGWCSGSRRPWKRNPRVAAVAEKSRRRPVPFWCSQSPFFPEGDRDGGGLCSPVSRGTEDRAPRKAASALFPSVRGSDAARYGPSWREATFWGTN